MADTKTRISVAVVAHEGGPVAGTKSDVLAVTQGSYETIAERTNGRVLSHDSIGTGSAETVPLSSLASAYLVFVANKATTGTLLFSVQASSGVLEGSVLPGGVAVFACKNGGYNLTAPAAISVEAPEGGRYEVIVAGVE